MEGKSIALLTMDQLPMMRSLLSIRWQRKSCEEPSTSYLHFSMRLLKDTSIAAHCLKLCKTKYIQKVNLSQDSKASFAHRQIQLFDSAAILVVEQAQVVGVLAHHRQRAEWVREAVPDRDALQSGQEALVVLGLAQDLLADGGGVLAAVALAEDEEGTVASDAEFLKAAVLTVVELFETLVQFYSHLGHVGDIRFAEVGICITEPCANRLVHKDYIVILRPDILISDNIEWSGITGHNIKRSELQKISHLTGGSRSSAQPEFVGMFLSSSTIACSLPQNMKAKAELPLLILRQPVITVPLQLQGVPCWFRLASMHQVSICTSQPVKVQRRLSVMSKPLCSQQLGDCSMRQKFAGARQVQRFGELFNRQFGLIVLNH